MPEGLSNILVDRREEFSELLSGKRDKVVISISGAELLALLKYQEEVGYRRALRKMKNTLDEDLISRDELRKILGVSNNTITTWKKFGKIEPVVVVGRKEYYRCLDLQEKNI